MKPNVMTMHPIVVKIFHSKSEEPHDGDTGKSGDYQS